MFEILYRGKRRDNGNWIIGYYLVVDGISYILPERCFLNGIVEVAPSTVGQYTGLTDKNGVKIFEGDIVKTKYGRLCSVEWFESNSVLCFDQRPIGVLENLLKKSPDKLDLWHKANLEVIGNVHDNPELLNEA